MKDEDQSQKRKIELLALQGKCTLGGMCLKGTGTYVLDDPLVRPNDLPILQLMLRKVDLGDIELPLFLPRDGGDGLFLVFFRGDARTCCVSIVGVVISRV